MQVNTTGEETKKSTWLDIIWHYRNISAVSHPICEPNKKSVSMVCLCFKFMVVIRDTNSSFYTETQLPTSHKSQAAIKTDFQLTSSHSAPWNTTRPSHSLHLDGALSFRSLCVCAALDILAFLKGPGEFAVSDVRSFKPEENFPVIIILVSTTGVVVTLIF